MRSGIGDQVFVKHVWDMCDPKEWLDVSQVLSRPLYEPIYDVNIYPKSEDKIASLKDTIELEGSESCQFFSGFSGSGKTTELKRLSKQLDDEGYVVLYSSALEYVSDTEPLNISDMLVVIAGAFGEALLGKINKETRVQSYWDRFVDFLKSEVELKEVSAKGEFSPFEGIKLGADVKTALRSSPSFRKLVQGVFNNKIDALKNDVHDYISQGFKLLKQQYPGSEGKIAFIIDDFEKIRGASDNELEVIQSVRHTFEHHLKRLELPFLHVIYTVPSWLGIALNNACHVEKLPYLRIWNRDAARTPYADGMRAARGLVARRFRFTTELNPTGSADINLQHAFGAPNADGDFALLDDLIRASGGHFRDLLRLIRSTVKSARSLPATSDDVARAIRTYKQDFLPIAVEDAVWLYRISRTQNYTLPNNEPKSVLQFSRFLDRQLVLYLTNGDEWYDIHPLLRDEVARIVAEEEQEQARRAAVASSASS